MVTNVAIDIKRHHVSTCCTVLDVVHPASMEKKTVEGNGNIFLDAGLVHSCLLSRHVLNEVRNFY